MRANLTHGIVVGCIVLAAVASLSAMSAIALENATAQNFVGRSGTSFMLNGRRFVVAGVNNHYLTYASEQEIIRVLDDAVAMNANVVRTFVQPVIGSLDGSTKTIWNWRSDADSSNLGSHGAYMIAWDPANSRMVFNDGEDGLRKLDFLMEEARQRKLKVILAFLDFWDYMGGAQQMSAWLGSTDKYTFFAQNARTRRFYKDWVAHLVMRVNSVNQVAYRDDPTIFAWELMNEPDIHPDALLMDWIREMSEYVKSLDAHHLLATGHSNIVNRLADLAVPQIDFGTWHGYAEYENISIERFDAQINEFCRLGQQHDKPVLLEEFALSNQNPRQAEAYRLWTSTLQRNPNCAGWLIWRLVSQQDGGRYPDDHDHFDIVNDGSPSWTVLRDAAGSVGLSSTQK